MIDRHPTGWSGAYEWLESAYGPEIVISPQLHGAENFRISALLGPDGNPLRVGFERPKLGFDLSPTKEKTP
jgi:hypothetical protein